MDLKDVLIRPKRSTLKSRADVNLDRTYTFLHSKKTWTGKAGVKEGVQTARVCVRTRERHEHCVLRLCLYMRRHTILLALCFCSFWSSQKFEACACEERSSTGSHTSPLSLVRDRFDAMERPSAFCSSRSRRGGTA